MRISQLSTLAKTAVVSADFLLTANSTNSVNQKLAVADLFPNITNYGSTTGAVSLISAVSSKNVYTLSKIVAGSTKITVSGGGGSADVSVDLGTISFSDISGTLTNTQLYGNIDLTQKVTGTLPTSNGGTGSTATAYCSLTSNVSGTLPTSKGGTGIDSSSSAFTRYALFYASNTTVMGQLAAATDGQVLIGSSSDAPVWASLTSGDGSIAITSGAGSIGLSVTSIPTINSNVEFTAGSDRYIKPKSATAAADRLYVQGGASTNGAGGDLYLEGGDTSHAGSNSGKVIISTGTGSSTIQDIQFIQNASSSTTATPLKIKDNRICITDGTTDRDPSNALHVWSKAGTGLATMQLQQLDTDEPFIRFEGDTASDQTKSLTTDTSVGSLTGHIRVSIKGTDYWIPYYAVN